MVVFERDCYKNLVVRCDKCGYVLGVRPFRKKKWLITGECYHYCWRPLTNIDFMRLVMENRVEFAFIEKDVFWTLIRM